MTQSRSVSIDSFDRNILNIMQKSNRATSEQIAERVGLSSAAVQRRLKVLREKQVILSDISVIDPKAVGRAMTFVVQVSLERERVDLIDIFKVAMKKNDAVQQCYYVTGSSDFTLIVTSADMAGYEQFTRDTFFENVNVRSFQTSVVMDSVKVSLSVPIDKISE